MTAIELHDVSLWRRTQEELSYDLKRVIFQSLERRYRRPARRRVLGGIDLRIERGEKVGIIGPNGAGKSTLLKVICGILSPTHGKVSVHGRIAPLIELGAGFDEDLTVVENIIYYGILLGFSRDEMRSRVTRILDFAELQEYARAPLKALSSGMFARLGFAVATDTQPEILILDEVLAVGDESFRRKSAMRVEEFWDAHSTILFVSHDLETIASQCERAIWLDKGLMRADGPALEVTRTYLKSVDEGLVEDADMPAVSYAFDWADSGAIRTELCNEKGTARVPVPLGSVTTLSGWAADVRRMRAAKAVIFEIDGVIIATAECTIARPDVVAYHHSLNMERSGFVVALPTNALVAGVHRISLRIVTSDFAPPGVVREALDFEVAPG